MNDVKHDAGMLSRKLYMWLLVENFSKVQSTCIEILKNPILSSNDELIRKINFGLTKNDLPFIKELLKSF